MGKIVKVSGPLVVASGLSEANKMCIRDRAISLASFFHLKKCAAARVAMAKVGRIPVSEQIVKGVRSYTKGSECLWIRVSTVSYTHLPERQRA